MTTTAAPALPRDLAANPRLSRWLTVTPEGGIGLRVGKVELGQGILTAVAQVAADELGVPLAQVSSLPAHTGLGPDEGLTAGSMSVFDAAPAVRLAAANVRALFCAEAARRWDIEPGSVDAVDGALVSRDGSLRSSYAELAGAVDLDVDVDPAVPTRTAEESRLVGSSAARVDLPDKIAGRARYITDIRLPGMLFARVVRPPSPGARLLDAPGTLPEHPQVQVVRDGSFLGVVGPREAQVVRAAEALRGATSWAEEERLPDEDDLTRFLTRGPHEDLTVLAEDRPPSAAGRQVTARYTRPFIAHASIGTSCGIARWEADGTITVWSHSQGIHKLRDAIAQALGRDRVTVVVEHAQNAGCYGHNGADDAAFDAVLLARAVPGTPVLLQWERADELAWSPLGSAMVADVAATVTDTGQIAGWTYDVYGQGHTTRPGYAGVPGLLAGGHLAEPLPTPAPDDPPSAAGGGTTRNAVPIYTVGARRITGHRLTETPLRTSAMRSLGAFMNVFAIESFVEELALACDEDPLTYRLRHLEDERARAVLEAAAGAAGWGTALDEGHGRGIGLARYKDKGAYCAVVADVEAEDRVRVHRLTVAVDVGRVINPDGVRNQIEGGATQATSWTLKERVRFDRRRITSVDWESYPILRFGEAPQVDVLLLDRPGLPSVGAGEAAQGPTAAAIGNAVAAAVGVRVRDLPITSAAVVAAIEAE